MKSIRLLSLLPTQPREFYDRVAAYAAYRWESARTRRGIYDPVSQDEAIPLLSRALGSEWGVLLDDAQLAEIDVCVQKKRAFLPADAPFGSFHNGDSVLARFCYAAVRILRPRLVVETGVGYGVTSAFILQALSANSHGLLHSIDLPPLSNDGDKYVGCLIPPQLRKRWTLHRGASRRLLAPLLEDCEEVDIFVHDSLHTYGNMRMEFDLAWPYMRSGAAIISDDIENNAAFLELSTRQDVANSIVVRQLTKNALFGIVVKR